MKEKLKTSVSCQLTKNLPDINHFLFQQRNEIELTAERKSNFLAWAGLGLMSIQFGILARLTWWEYSWDIMEPVTYFVTYGTAMAAYAYFVLTKEVRKLVFLFENLIFNRFGKGSSFLIFSKVYDFFSTLALVIILTCSIC